VLARLPLDDFSVVVLQGRGHFHADLLVMGHTNGAVFSAAFLAVLADALLTAATLPGALIPPASGKSARREVMTRRE